MCSPDSVISTSIARLHRHQLRLLPLRWLSSSSLYLAPARPAAQRRLWWCWILHLPCVCIACQAHLLSVLVWPIPVEEAPRRYLALPVKIASNQQQHPAHSQPASNKPRLRRFVPLPVSRFFFLSRFCLARDSCCLFPAADLLVTTQF